MEVGYGQFQSLRHATGVQLWTLWTVATIFGATMGMVAGLTLCILLYVWQGYMWGLATYAVVTAAGVGVAFAQWLILRAYTWHAGWWVPATAVAWVVVLSLGVTGSITVPGQWPGLTQPAIAAPSIDPLRWGLAGAVVGFAQWLLLRERVTKAGWWVPVTTAACLAAAAVGKGLHAIGRATACELIPGHPSAELLAAVTVMGAATGLLLVPLSQRLLSTHRSMAPDM